MKPKTCPDTASVVASPKLTPRTKSDTLRPMQPGAVIATTIDSEPIVLVGTVPTGHTVILCPKGWRELQRWKLIRLRIVRGTIRACGDGRAAGFAAARFLLNASYNHIVRYRNGNPFDIRLSNIVVLSRGLLRQAKIEETRGTDYKNPEVRWGDGHCHAGNPLNTPSARERVTKALAPPQPNVPAESPQESTEES